MSTSIVLLVLGAGWCAYLVVWWRDARKSTGHGGDAIRSFSDGMGTLGGSAGAPSPMTSLGNVELRPRSVAAAARRRQHVFTVLGGLAAVSLLAALVLGALAVFIHLLIDAALIAYAYAVVQRRNLHAEREMKVKMLYPEGVTPIRAERRTVNA